MTYIYYYVRHEDEVDLCRLEMRALFHEDTDEPILQTTRKIDPSRSPFIKGRIDIIAASAYLEDIYQAINGIRFPVEETVKLISVNDVDFGEEKKWSHEKRRQVEKDIGLHFTCTVDLVTPDHLYGVLYYNGMWYVGPLTKSEPVWLHHQQKPHTFSTALNTRDARAIANIAVPFIDDSLRVIDPCCGIGTVVLEALSIGIPIVGSDKNFRVCQGSRKNIAHFGYETEITKRSIHTIEQQYDVAILDLPYNLFTHITEEETEQLLHSAHRIAEKVIVIAIDPVDDMLKRAQLVVCDRAEARKGTFTREVIVTKRKR